MAKTQNTRGVSHQPASWAAAWLLVTCSSPVYLVVDNLKSCVLWALMIGLGGPVDVFLR